MTVAEPCFTVVLVGDDEFIAWAEPQIQRATLLLGIGSVGADQAVATATGRAPDVVVIADPPGPDGPPATQLAREIGRRLAACRVLLVARDGAVGSADADALLDAWIGGVTELGSDDLAEAIEQLGFGEALLDQPLAAAVLERHRAGRSPVKLSPTEHEVITRLAGGATADALAEEYSVTPRMVRLHASGPLARLHPGA